MALQFTFDVAILTIFGGELKECYKQELKKNYSIVDKGYNSLPTNIPGTLYNKAVLVRLSSLFILLALSLQQNWTTTTFLKAVVTCVTSYTGVSIGYNGVLT